jgi:hypothetical protein
MEAEGRLQPTFLEQEVSERMITMMVAERERQMVDGGCKGKKVREGCSA